MCFGVSGNKRRRLRGCRSCQREIRIRSIRAGSVPEIEILLTAAAACFFGAHLHGPLVKCETIGRRSIPRWNTDNRSSSSKVSGRFFFFFVRAEGIFGTRAQSEPSHAGVFHLAENLAWLLGNGYICIPSEMIIEESGI